MKVIFFGRLKDIAGRKEIEIKGIKKVSELKRYLFEMYPELENIPFSVAVNKKVSHDDTKLKDTDEVAHQQCLAR